MTNQRRFIYSLMLLYVLDAFSIDHVTAGCSDMPAGENWANTWDQPVHFDCGRGKSISRVHSIHRNCKEDRIWAFSCEENAAAKDCDWTPTLNTFDGDLDYKCPHDGFITGIKSRHNNHHEDRRFQFKCCHSHDYKRTKCRYSLYTTRDDPFTYYTHDRYYLAGAESDHHNHYEDRRWRFYSCQRVLAKK